MAAESKASRGEEDVGADGDVEGTTRVRPSKLIK